MRVNTRFLMVGLILTLAIAAVVPATAQETVPAQVTVSQVISLTVTDNGAPGINFGEVNSGATNVADAGQTSSVGAVTLTINGGTNVNCMLQLAGSGDFTTTTGTIRTFGLAAAKYSTGTLASAAQAMSTTYQDIMEATSNTLTTAQIYHWLTVPADQGPGTYTTDFYYRANPL